MQFQLLHVAQPLVSKAHDLNSFTINLKYDKNYLPDYIFPLVFTHNELICIYYALFKQVTEA